MLSKRPLDQVHVYSMKCKKAISHTCIQNTLIHVIGAREREDRRGEERTWGSLGFRGTFVGRFVHVLSSCDVILTSIFASSLHFPCWWCIRANLPKCHTSGGPFTYKWAFTKCFITSKNSLVHALLIFHNPLHQDEILANVLMRSLLHKWLHWLSSPRGSMIN
jgi:hypothetical protein